MKVTSCCFLLSLLLLAAPGLRAQNVQETRIRFAKAEQPGLIAEFPFPAGVANAALHTRLEQAGLKKPKSEKGFDSYQGVSWPEISPGQVDVYARVDRKDDQISTVVLLVSKGYDNYVSAASDPVLSAKLKSFLSSLLPDMQMEQTRVNIGLQEEIVRKAEKAYKDADENGNKLARDKERIEKQLAENEVEKGRRAGLLDAARTKLDQLRAQLK